MKERLITNETERFNAIQAIQKIPFPFVVGVGEEKLRSTTANSRYWATLDGYLQEIMSNLTYLSEETGHTVRELKHMIGNRLTPDQAEILYARDKKAVHEVLKDICGVDSSARLGTKKFAKFQDIMENTLIEAVSSVDAVISAYTRQVG